MSSGHRGPGAGRYVRHIAARGKRVQDNGHIRFELCSLLLGVFSLPRGRDARVPNGRTAADAESSSRPLTLSPPLREAGELN